MKVCILFVVVCLAFASAYPLEEEYDGTGSRTWEAIKNFFRPIGEWFSSSLPQKTPSELMDDAYETAVDAKDWAVEHPIVQGVGEAVKPVQTWVQDKVDSVKDRTFGDIYGDVKTSVAEVDDSVGGWVEKNVG